MAKRKLKKREVLNGFNMFERQYFEEFIENLIKELNKSFDIDVRDIVQKLKVEYKRDKQDAINTGITAYLEERIKEWVCPRIPQWINSDHLTALGVFAIILVALGFILGFQDKIYLLLVVVGLFLHWFGDSFDGSLARYRKKTRPNYGYYIDHMVDAVAVIIFSLGLGISGFVRIDLALLFAIMYMALMIHVELVTFVQSKFKYSFGLIGPTEMRIFGVFITIYMYFAPVKYFNVIGYYISQYDIAFLIMSALMGIVLFISILRKAIELDRKDRAKWSSKM